MLTLRVHVARRGRRQLRQLRALPSHSWPDDAAGAPHQTTAASYGSCSPTPDSREVFNPLAGDIAAAAARGAWRRQRQSWQPSAGSSIGSGCWRSSTDTGLTPEARRGLFGELSILRCAPAGHDVLRRMLVAAWTGPAADEPGLPAAWRGDRGQDQRWQRAADPRH